MGTVQLGDRGALRASSRGHPPVRHEHVTDAAGVRSRRAAGAVRPDGQRVPGFFLRGADGRCGGVHRGRAAGDRRWSGRGRGARPGRQGVPAGRLGSPGADPDLPDVWRPDIATCGAHRHGAATGADTGFALDVPAVLAKLPEVRVVWLCSPNNPTGAVRRTEPIWRPWSRLHRSCRSAARGRRRGVFRVQRHDGHPVANAGTRTFWRSAPFRRRSRSPACGSAMPSAAAAVIERLERVRPPGSISTVSAHVATRALQSPGYARENAATLSRERDWLAAKLASLVGSQRPASATSCSCASATTMRPNEPPTGYSTLESSRARSGRRTRCVVTSG